MIEGRSQPRLQGCELVMLAWEQDRIRYQQVGNVQDVWLDGMWCWARPSLCKRV
jgi:hypothetical protein